MDRGKNQREKKEREKEIEESREEGLKDVVD